jgi:hypothetical protein
MNVQVFVESADPLDSTLGVFINGRRSGNCCHSCRSHLDVFSVRPVPLVQLLHLWIDSAGSKTQMFHGDSLKLGSLYLFQLVHPPSAREGAGFQLLDYDAVEKERKAWAEKEEALSAASAAAQAMAKRLEGQSQDFQDQLRNSVNEKVRLELQLKSVQSLRAQDAKAAEEYAATVEAIKKNLKETQDSINAMNAKMLSDAKESKEKQADELEALRRQLAEAKMNHETEISSLRNKLRAQELAKDMKWSESLVLQTQESMRVKEAALARLNRSEDEVLVDLMGQNLEQRLAEQHDQKFEDFMRGLVADAESEAAGSARGPSASTTPVNETKEQMIARRRAELARKKAEEHAEKDRKLAESAKRIQGEMLLEIKMAINLVPPQMLGGLETISGVVIQLSMLLFIGFVILPLGLFILFASSKINTHI